MALKLFYKVDFVTYSLTGYFRPTLHFISTMHLTGFAVEREAPYIGFSSFYTSSFQWAFGKCPQYASSNCKAISIILVDVVRSLPLTIHDRPQLAFLCHECDVAFVSRFSRHAKIFTML
jgi:hypothetical protein